MTVGEQKFGRASIITLVMLVTLFLKALIPAGFMPGVEGGMTKLVICSGMGEKTVYIPSGDTPDPDQKKSSGEVCAYQILSSQKEFITPPSLFIPATAGILVSYEIAHDENVIARSVFISHARGPPSSV